MRLMEFQRRVQIAEIFGVGFGREPPGRDAVPENSVLHVQSPPCLVGKG
jgi:hypothetical protein